MKTNYLLVLLIIVLLTGVNMPTRAQEERLSVPDGAQAGDLTELTSCTYQPAASKTSFDAECGTLTVPENRNDESSRLLGLPVVKIPSTGSNPAEPVFWFQGGPGSSNMSFTPWDWLLAKHDVVIVGYRGMDGTVFLDCPETTTALNQQLGKNFYTDEARQELINSARQCAENLSTSGIDLRGYTISEVVEDMEAARQALGYEKINIYSVSYGTRVAQIYAYLYPNSLHRVVLNGVNTPGHFIYNRDTFDDMIRYLSELCSQDPTCSKRTDNLAQAIYEVNHNMPERWLFFPIDAGSMRFAMQMMFFQNQNMPMVIDAYIDASHGDPSGLAMLNLMGNFISIPITFGDMLSKGGSGDLGYYQGLESISLGESILGAPMSEMIWPMAAAFPVTLMDEELRGFQETDVDMLLINGTVDFSTPPTALDEAKPYYHNAQMVLLPEFSHVSDVELLQPEAFERLINSYYDTGIADDSLFEYQPITFGSGISLSTIAKLLVGAGIVIPLLLIGAVYGIVRWWRHRNQSTRHSA